MKPHEEWLFKAEHDLASARVLLTSPEMLFDISIYHTQQCAEKALKAFLTFNELEIDKTHNLKVLLDRCVVQKEEFAILFEDCIFLNPFATLYRYPEGDLMPSKSEVEKALIIAERILNFVKGQING